MSKGIRQYGQRNRMAGSAITFSPDYGSLRRYTRFHVIEWCEANRAYGTRRRTAQKPSDDPRCAHDTQQCFINRILQNCTRNASRDGDAIHAHPAIARRVRFHDHSVEHQLPSTHCEAAWCSDEARSDNGHRWCQHGSVIVQERFIRFKICPCACECTERFQSHSRIRPIRCVLASRLSQCLCGFEWIEGGASHEPGTRGREWTMNHVAIAQCAQKN